MSKIRNVLTLAAILAAQQVFADDVSGLWSGSNKSCEAIAKACTAAGYSRKNDPDKRFWVDCMGPVLLNKTVSGVKLETNTVQDCRSAKIEELKKELDAFQKASTN